jgi:hypothetical protein
VAVISAPKALGLCRKQKLAKNASKEKLNPSTSKPKRCAFRVEEGSTVQDERDRARAANPANIKIKIKPRNIRANIARREALPAMLFTSACLVLKASFRGKTWQQFITAAAVGLENLPRQIPPLLARVVLLAGINTNESRENTNVTRVEEE